MKATWSEIKHNTQETNSDGKETGTQINDLEQKEEINIQLEQNEETRIRKNEETFELFWQLETFQYLIYRGCQKEKNNSKKLKTYLNK